MGRWRDGRGLGGDVASAEEVITWSKPTQWNFPKILQVSLPTFPSVKMPLDLSDWQLSSLLSSSPAGICSKVQFMGFTVHSYCTVSPVTFQDCTLHCSVTDSVDKTALALCPWQLGWRE